MRSTSLPALDTTPRAGLVARLRARALRLEPLSRDLVLLAFRFAHGYLFLQTGFGKATHLERTSGYFETLGFPAPEAMAAVAGATELVGGALLMLGLGARAAAAALTGVLMTAYLTAHRAEAFQSVQAFSEQTPYPYLLACLAVLVFGAGRFSADGWLAGRRGAKRGGGAR